MEMNMASTVSLFGGGPGSGCHGPNCGRSKRLQDAVDLATDAHKDQKDKSGHPYIDHPVRVMDAVKEHGELAQIAAVLHDVVEDTPVTLKEIEKQFGPEVASAVDAVSQRKGEKYFDYVQRVSQHPVGRVVKVADIKDNMRPDRSLGRNWDSMTKRYSKALEMLK